MLDDARERQRYQLISAEPKMMPQEVGHWRRLIVAAGQQQPGINNATQAVNRPADCGYQTLLPTRCCPLLQLQLGCLSCRTSITSMAAAHCHTSPPSPPPRTCAASAHCSSFRWHAPWLAKYTARCGAAAASAGAASSAAE